MSRLLSTDESPRGNVELLLQLVERSLGFGAEARLCAPPDFADRRTCVDEPLAQIGGWR